MQDRAGQHAADNRPANHTPCERPVNASHRIGRDFAFNIKPARSDRMAVGSHAVKGMFLLK